MPTSPRISRKKNSKKASKKTSRKLSAKSRKLVDDVLVKVSPQVQKRVDQLIETLQNTREARMGDLKWLGGQILLRSREVSEQLKKLKAASRGKTSKKTSRKK